MIKVLGRAFETPEAAIRFLNITIKMESNPMIRQQLEHKLEYLKVELQLKKEANKKLRRKK
jgi:uncharacterized lipoprotein YehR (DUF1307 family)